MTQRDEWQSSIVGELRRLAGAAMQQERQEHTLQPTALVNEAFLVLQRQQNLRMEDKSQFMAAASNTIRRILVDHARVRAAKKRGGPDAKRIPLNITLPGEERQLDILDLNDALEELAKKNERAAQIVEYRFFGGMTGQEIADELGVSIRTVNNDWKFSKAWLYMQMTGNSDSCEED